MRFTVPQFIDYETKIIGPLTLKQFIFLAMAGTISVILYFTVHVTLLFLFVSILAFSTAFALAFVKINGKDLPTVFVNFLKFNFSSKMFLWGKKQVPSVIYTKEEIKREVIEDEVPLKMGEKSQLKNIRTEIETKTK